MIMPNKIDHRFLAPCGVNCFVCYVHLKKNKPCDGCYGDDKDKPERCKNCSIKICCIENRIKYCFECSGYPCIKIKNMKNSYIKRYNVDINRTVGMVKDKGLDLFFENEIKKWKCDKCGGVITQHGNTCSECNV